MLFIKCNTCGATDLTESDICGDSCIYCAGEEDYYKREREWLKKNDMSCMECGEIQTRLTNNMCDSCFSLWENHKLEWQK